MSGERSTGTGGWGCPTLVGRASELDALREAVEAHGGLVVVSGEAGVGKTRLLREFIDEFSGGGGLVLWARPEAVASPGALSLVVDLLEGVASLPGLASDEAEQLSEALSHWASSGQDFPARRMAARVRGVIGLSEAKAVIFEDLHRADELSLAIVTHLSRSAGSDRIPILGSLRPEELEGNAALGRMFSVVWAEGTIREIHLEPLESEHVVSMLKVMRGEEIDERAILEILRLSEGVPLFVEELARSWGVGAGSIPPSIAHSVRLLLDALDSEARRIVAVASLVHGRLSPALLAHVCERQESDIVTALAQAVRHGILEDVQGVVSFRHALLRDAIASSWVSVERNEFHSRIAEALIELFPSEQDRWAGAVADHLLAAGQATRALPYLLQAGDSLRASGALEESKSRYATALEVGFGSKGAALLGMGEVLGRSGDLGEAVLKLQQAQKEFTAEGDVSGALEAVHAEAKYGGALVDVAALDALDRGFHLVSDTDSPEYVRLIVHKGDLLVRRFQRLDEGAPLLALGRELADQLGSEPLLCEVHEGLAWVAAGRGRAVEAAQHGARACELALRVGEEDLILRTQSNQALRLAHCGRGEDSVRLLDGVRRDLVRSAGHMAAPVDHLLCLILWILGRPAAADHTAVPLESTRYALEFGRVVRAWAAVERGQDAIAWAIAERWWSELGGSFTRDQAIRNEEFFLEHASQVALCELVAAAYSGAQVSPESLALFRRYHSASVDGGIPESRGLSAVLLARVLLANGFVDEARDALSVIDEGALEEYPIRRGCGLYTRAELLMRLGDRVQARQELEESVELLSSAGNTGDLVRAQRLLSEVREDAVESSESLRLLSGLRKMAVDVGSLREVNQIESQMRRYGGRPRAGRPRGSGVKSGELSAREEEVVSLLASGASNSQIAANLFISERTVEGHVARAQRRLGVAGRAGLAAWAAKKGLI